MCTTDWQSVDQPGISPTRVSAQLMNRLPACSTLRGGRAHLPDCQVPPGTKHHHRKMMDTRSNIAPSKVRKAGLPPLFGTQLTRARPEDPVSLTQKPAKRATAYSPGREPWERRRYGQSPCNRRQRTNFLRLSPLCLKSFTSHGSRRPLYTLLSGSKLYAHDTDIHLH